jgi:hypothetical protein
VGAGSLATRRLNLFGSGSLRQRIDVQTRIRAVELRTNSGVLMHIDIAKLSLDLDVLVKISPGVEMFRNYADLGISARQWKIHGLFTALRVSGQTGIGECGTEKH